MPERSFGRDAIPNKLFQLLHIGEAIHRLAIPDLVSVDEYLKYAAGSGEQGNFANFFTERAQKFLRIPRRAKQPLALSAVMNLDSW